MIGIADSKLWNLGVGLLSKWSDLTFYFIYFISILNLSKSAYFFLRPVTLPQPGLGRIAEQVQVLVA